LFRLQLLLLILVLTTIVAGTAFGNMIYMVSGTSSTGDPIEFQADFAMSGDILTLTLKNTSPVDSASPADVLGSCYFEIVRGAIRPNLSFTSAAGEVYLSDKSHPDTPYNGIGADNLLWNHSGDPWYGDDCWEFKSFDPTQNPFMGFGVATVGNSNLAPNNFNGNMVHTVQLSIYKGEIATQNLDGKYLVKDEATFTWSGVNGFSESDIAGVAFGLGTAPDSVLTTDTPVSSVPEPATCLLLMNAGAIGLAYARRSRNSQTLR
jgi:hypothetical protein